jgi:hypothetical protein
MWKMRAPEKTEAKFPYHFQHSLLESDLDFGPTAAEVFVHDRPKSEVPVGSLCIIDDGEKLLRGSAASAAAAAAAAAAGYTYLQKAVRKQASNAFSVVGRFHRRLTTKAITFPSERRFPPPPLCTGSASSRRRRRLL